MDSMRRAPLSSQAVHLLVGENKMLQWTDALERPRDFFCPILVCVFYGMTRAKKVRESPHICGEDHPSCTRTINSGLPLSHDRRAFVLTSYLLKHVFANLVFLFRLKRYHSSSWVNDYISTWAQYRRLFKTFNSGHFANTCKFRACEVRLSVRTPCSGLCGVEKKRKAIVLCPKHLLKHQLARMSSERPLGK